MLGSLDVVRDDGERVAIRAAKQRKLLTTLLLHANRWVSVDKIVDVLWDGAPPRSAAGNTKTYVWKLRTALASGRIANGPGGYRVDVGRDEVDALRFEDLLRAGRDALAAHREQDAARLLAEGLGLWRGEPYADLTDDDAEAARSRLTEQRLSAREDLAEVRLALGEPVVVELGGLVRANPLRERPYGLLMLALYRDGRQAEALTVYRDLRAVLDRELGLAPSEDLVLLHRDILNQAPRLKPEPRTAVWRHVPAQLPANVAGFTGRDKALARLGDDADVWVVTGPPGVGKTALAVRWGHHNADRFPDGQLYVDLGGFSTGAPLTTRDAMGRLLRSLDTPPDRIPHDVAEQTALYRSLMTGRRVLVVLDNARGSEDVRPLLPGRPGCVVIVTSRNDLHGLVGLDDARALSLGALGDDDTIGLFRHVLGAHRVEAELDDVRRLSGLCGNLPLAVRLAAATLAAQPDRRIGDLADRMENGNRLTALAVGTESETTVRAAFDLSYAALPPRARVLFRRLALAPGPDFTAHVARALAGDTADGLLADLCGAHLVDHYAPGRYRFHDLLRAYAVERADDEGDRHDALDAVLPHYLRWTRAAVNTVFLVGGPTATVDGTGAAPEFEDEASALAWLDAEHANLVAAVDLAAEHGPAHVTWQLVDALHNYFWSRRNELDWTATAETALRAAESAEDGRAQATVHRTLGLAHWARGDGESSIRHSKRALELSRATGYLLGEARALTSLGLAHGDRGGPAEAADFQAAALAIDLANGNDYRAAVSRCNLGFALTHLGYPGDAVERFEASLVTMRALGKRYAEASVLNGLGVARLELGDVDLAADLLEESLLAARETSHHHCEVGSLTALVDVRREQSDHEAAARCAEQALELARDREMAAEEGTVLTAMAELALAGGDHDAARRHATEALRIQQEAGYPYGRARALRALGWALGDGAGGPYLVEAQAVFDTFGTPRAEELRGLGPRKPFTGT
ncbi:AfsR/SARP family transcriptional regulator [Umezawaea sp.]|uniref:AfsR/SARP family transcriptional regulator n=1 Tax=Umezawaea sp. TaxID=1955258 RepID=UPI002ED52D80